jgi:hypothetical protein
MPQPKPGTVLPKTSFGDRQVTIYIGTKKHEATQLQFRRGPRPPYCNAYYFQLIFVAAPLIRRGALARSACQRRFSWEEIHSNRTERRAQSLELTERPATVTSPRDNRLSAAVPARQTQSRLSGPLPATDRWPACRLEPKS